jgi:hypothetical protein
MANENPMGSGDAVALQIPAEDREFLRRLFEMARDGIRDELVDYPDALKAPAHLRREKAVYEALLVALKEGTVVPDHHMREVVRDLAELNDRENEYARVVAEHAALLGLCEQLGGGEGR